MAKVSSAGPSRPPFAAQCHRSLPTTQRWWQISVPPLPFDPRQRGIWQRLMRRGIREPQQLRQSGVLWRLSRHPWDRIRPRHSASGGSSSRCAGSGFTLPHDGGGELERGSSTDPLLSAAAGPGGDPTTSGQHGPCAGGRAHVGQTGFFWSRVVAGEDDTCRYHVISSGGARLVAVIVFFFLAAET